MTSSRHLVAFGLLSLILLGPPTALANPDAGASPPSVLMELPLRVVVVSFFRSPDLAREKERLEALRDRATPPERALLDRMIRLFASRPPDPADAKKAFPEVQRIVRDFGALTGAIVSQADALMALAALADELDVDSKGIYAEAVALAEQFLSEHPKSAVAYMLLGQVLNAGGRDPVGALRVLKRCLELKVDPIPEKCWRLYDLVAQEYLAPYCAKGRLRTELAVFGADEAPPGARPNAIRIDHYGLALELEAVPSLSAGDFQRTRIDPNQPFELIFAPTNPGRAKLDALFARLAKRRGYLAVMLGREPLYSFQIERPFTNSPIPVSERAGAATLLKRVCREIVHPSIPPDARFTPPESWR